MPRGAGTIEEVGKALAEGLVIPYLGPGVFREATSVPFPIDSMELAEWLSARVSVPGRIRGNLTAIAQYIESHKHRKTLTRLMGEAFSCRGEGCLAPTRVHRLLTTLPRLPLVVDTWYDATAAEAFSDPGGQRRALCQISGVSRSEHPDRWFQYAGDGEPFEAAASDRPEASTQKTILYKPHGSVAPEPNFLVSDSDYVEVLTEIDIQTPIPPPVQRLREGRHFLFLGCRFNQQLDRIFARQIMKRSSQRHWAVFASDGELTKKEARFLEVQHIAPLWANAEPLVEGLTAVMAATAEFAREETSCRSA